MNQTSPIPSSKTTDGLRPAQIPGLSSTALPGQEPLRKFAGVCPILPVPETRAAAFLCLHRVFLLSLPELEFALSSPSSVPSHPKRKALLRRESSGFDEQGTQNLVISPMSQCACVFRSPTPKLETCRLHPVLQCLTVAA